MSGELRITVRGLSKRYRLEADKARSARHRARRWIRRALRRSAPRDVPAGEDFFWALKDVGFEVRDGERLGIIGRNGAGKTTLLKILSRVAYPTEGEARIRGRVTALLEVGTGFNPRLTGRDNIYLNSSLHGLTHGEIKAKLDEIVEFSGVGRFLDLPVNHYSSGMRMRLAFSIAAHLDPDILLLDEVLAVGDLAFQQKCLKRVEGLTSQGRTILFVSHGMGNIVRFCNRVLWLDHGRIRFTGDVATGVQLYQHEVLAQEGVAPGIPSFVERKGTGLARFTRVEVLDAELRPIDRVHTGQQIYIALHYELPQALPRRPWDVFVFCAVENDKKQRIFGLPSEVLPVDLTDLPRAGRFLCRVESLPLVPGIYDLTMSLLIDRELADKVVGAKKLVVFEGDFYGTGKLPIPSFGQVCTRFHWSVEPSEPADAAVPGRPAASPAWPGRPS
jgi:lipopolysaccharide transport system ATP-binding protein